MGVRQIALPLKQKKMKVRFLKDYSNKKKGDESDLTPYIAKELIAKGIAEHIEIAKKRGRKSKNDK